MSPEDPDDGGRPAMGATDGADRNTAGRLDEQLCFALYAASTEMTRVYRPMLSEFGLTYPQYLVLLILWEHRRCSVGEIAERLFLATHAISPIIDRLEEAGLVRRVADPDDGRVVQVELTDAGVGLEGAAIDIQEQVRCRTELDDPDVVRLRAELVALAQRLRTT